MKPKLERLERSAAADFFRATCSGEWRRPKAGTFDPLWLRQGMRANLKLQRAGWAVSSPHLDASLRRSPENDPSLPGPGWLREVYVYRDRELVTLPGVLSRIEARRALLIARRPEQRAPEAMSECAQLEMFA